MTREENPNINPYGITEEWRWVKGYTNRYKVSNLGGLHTIENKTLDYKHFQWTTPAADGMPRVRLYKDGQWKNRKIAMIVVSAFQTIPSTKKIRIKDARAWNNWLGNIELVDK
jgi:hypothetical protein